MKLFNFFRKLRGSREFAGFSDFLLHASKHEKEKVFREAASRANEEQREVLNKSRFIPKTN